MDWTASLYQERDLTAEEWKQLLQALIPASAKNEVPLEYLAVTADSFMFNGKGRDGCESCCVSRTVLSYCHTKTRLLPYTALVVEVYRIAAQMFPEIFKACFDPCGEAEGQQFGIPQ